MFSPSTFSGTKPPPDESVQFYIIGQLGMETFGLWSLIFAVIGIFGLMDFGFATAAVKTVAEATGANVFFVKDGALHTPTPDCFLNGLTRQTVIGMLKDRQVKVHERHIMPEELEGFEQCWLTGTAAEVTPVGQIGDYNFEVGKMTQDISAEYEKLVRS